MLAQLSPKRFFEAAVESGDDTIFYSGSHDLEYIPYVMLRAVFKFLESRNIQLRKKPDFVPGVLPAGGVLRSIVQEKSVTSTCSDSASSSLLFAHIMLVMVSLNTAQKQLRCMGEVQKVLS